MEPIPTNDDDTVRKRTLELPVPNAYSRPRQDDGQLLGAVNHPSCEQVQYDAAASYAGYPVPGEGAPMEGGYGEPVMGPPWQQVGADQQFYYPPGGPQWQNCQGYGMPPAMPHPAYGYYPSRPVPQHTTTGSSGFPAPRAGVPPPEAHGAKGPTGHKHLTNDKAWLCLAAVRPTGATSEDRLPPLTQTDAVSSVRALLEEIGIDLPTR